MYVSRSESAVSIRLVDDELDLSWEFAVSWDVRHALRIQLQRCLCPSGVARFEDRFVSSLGELLDEDLQLPTASQVSYAMAISKGLGIALPGEALQFKGSMHEFLSRNAPIFKAQGVEMKSRKPLRSHARKWFGKVTRGALSSEQPNGR